MNCPRMDGSPRDPLGLPLTPPRVPAHPVQSDTDNVVGGSQDAARHGLSRRAQPTSPQLANGDPLSVSLDAPSHDFCRLRVRARRVSAPVAGEAERVDVLECRDAVVAAGPGVKVAGELAPVADLAAALAGEVVAVQGGEAEPLPGHAAPARRLPLLVPAPIIGALAVDAELAAWFDDRSAAGQSLMIGIRSPPPCELEPWLGQRVVADDGVQGKRFCVSKRRLYPTRA